MSHTLFRVGLSLLGMLLLLAADPRAAEPAKEKERTKPNRLVKESSPYLLQHAHNPVDWYPWGAEAFERAKKEKKLVFLSIGYSSCHWCHVMERESFSNRDVADYMNQHFVCIKVDREERPDIDDIYMTALHVMGARGGWPLSMFLSPEGRPIVGGTYWPREDREINGESLSGFTTILKRVDTIWREKPKEVAEQAEHFAEKTNESLGLALRGNPIVALNRALANGGAELIRENIDPVHGGIGSKEGKHKGTKFPMPTAVGLLLEQAVRDKDDDLRRQVLLTLDKMLMGGIYDQAGGGFHRYSTERTWTVPHFEKMLYDNAQLVELYAEAYRQTRNPTYARVIRETLAFVQREMTSPEGGFYSALDADSNGNEGEFYVWTPEEIEKALGAKADSDLLRAVYGVDGRPNFEEKQFILKLSRPLEEIAKEQKLPVEELEKKLTAAKTKLLEYRGKRARPFLDTKILTAWNGQMIAAYAKAGEVLKEPEYVKTAVRATEFVLKNLRTKDGRLLRTYGKNGDGKAEAKLNAYLDDYASFIHGLLNLHDATGENRWLDEAKALTEIVVKWHGDPNGGGYFFTSSDHEKLFARPKDYFDGAQPSANGTMVGNLVSLWQKTKADGYRQLAEKSFRQFAGILRSNANGVPGLCSALHRYLDAVPEAKEPKKEDPKKVEAKIDRTSKTDDVVKMVATAEKPVNGKRTATIKLTIEKPWHIYANPTGNAGVKNQTTITVRVNGKPIEAEIEYPEGTKVVDKDSGDYRIYTGEVVIKATFPQLADAEMAVDIWAKVQACSEEPNARCLQQATLKTTLK